MVAGNREPSWQSCPVTGSCTQDPPKASSAFQPLPPPPSYSSPSEGGGEPAGHAPRSWCPTSSSGAHLPELQHVGRQHTLDRPAWGPGAGDGTDGSRQPGFSGSQVPLPIIQPCIVLEIPKNKCDRQKKVPSQKTHTSSFLESFTSHSKGHFAGGIK